MFSTAAKACVPLVLVGDVGVEQRQVELDVHGLLEQLARQVHARLRGVDVLVEVQHQVVRDDRVAGREERDQALDQVPLGRRSASRRSATSVCEVDLLDRPRVLDRVPVHRRRSAGSASAAASGRAPGRAGSWRWSWSVRSWWSLAGLAALGVLERAGDCLGLAHDGQVGDDRGGAHGRLLRSASPGATAGSTSSSARSSRRRGTSTRACRSSGLGDEQVQRLALVDERRPRGRHVDQRPLRQLPGGAEQHAHVLGQLRDALHGAFGPLDARRGRRRSTGRAP